MTGPVNFGINASGAYGLMGYLSGISKQVKTDVYINSVLNYTHATLADYFDQWLDGVARARPQEFQHVYKWPRVFQNYSETVGNPVYRLWRQTLTGRGRNKVASFKFLAETRPTPVNPLLLQPGKNGRTVKTGVHVFVLKAEAMEYGIDIKVSPKLAKMLAYVGQGRPRTGADAGYKAKNSQGVRFSAGPVHFTAGGKTTVGKFTGAFLSWWNQQAPGEFDRKIAPRLAADLISQAELNAAIRRGNKSNKTFSISAAAENNTRSFAEAEALAVAKMAENERAYINQAGARRSLIYGD